jgi:hypothetical protein
MRFERNAVALTAWRDFLKVMHRNYDEVHADDEDAVYLVHGTYEFCGAFPEVEEVPRVAGITFQKWYEEREPDEEGTL